MLNRNANMEPIQPHGVLKKPDSERNSAPILYTVTPPVQRQTLYRWGNGVHGSLGIPHPSAHYKLLIVSKLGGAYGK